MNNKDTPAALTVLLGVLIALSALGTDLYVSALPDLERSLSASVSAVQLTLTAYFIGLACGQLLWGPLSDRYGRKPILLFGLSIMFLSSVSAALMESVAAVTAARLAQGFGMSGGVVIARSVVRDLHANEQAARLLARMTIVFSIVPIAAPLTGALLVSHSGWQAVFWAMAVVGAILLAAVAIGLAETAPAERRSAHPVDIARTLASILVERRFISPFLLFLSCQMGVLAWVSNSAFTLVRGSGVSIVAYGWMFAGVMLGQIAGSWASSRLVLRLGIQRMLRVGAVLSLGAGAVAAALAWGGVAHWLAVVLPFMVFLFGTALIVPNATALALSPFPGTAGAASSLLGAIGFFAGAGVSTALGAAFDGTSRPMATVAALAGIGAFVFERTLVRGKA